MIINMNGAKAPETPSSVLQEKTVTPEILPTVIGPDEGYDGLSQVTVNPDSQLIPTNIRSGKTVFGVEGTFVGEPQPTDELDYTLIKTTGGFSDLSNTLAFGYSPVIEENPTRLTEVNFTTRYALTAGNAYLGYGNGLVMCSNTDKLSMTPSSYIPSVTSYYWYHKSDTIPSGEMKFYIQEKYKNVVTNSTHITGECWLVPILWLSTSDNYPIGSLTAFLEGSSEEIIDLNSIVIDAELVDSDITGYQFSKMFTLNVPETTFGSYGYMYNSAKKAALTYAFVPKQIVIS